MTLAAVGVGLVAFAFLLSAVLCGVVRRLAPRLGLVDKPGGRKAHARVTPLGGGVAIWLTTVLVLATAAVAVWLGDGWLPAGIAEHLRGLRLRAGELAGIVALATAIMIMGLIDDRKGLSPWL